MSDNIDIKKPTDMAGEHLISAIRSAVSVLVNLREDIADELLAGLSADALELKIISRDAKERLDTKE